MEYKDADRSNIGRENTGKTWNQQCSAEKYRGSDYVDRSHRGCDRDKAVDPERAVGS